MEGNGSDNESKYSNLTYNSRPKNNRKPYSIKIKLFQAPFPVYFILYYSINFLFTISLLASLECLSQKKKKILFFYFECCFLLYIIHFTSFIFRKYTAFFLYFNEGVVKI